MELVTKLSAALRARIKSKRENLLVSVPTEILLESMSSVCWRAVLPIKTMLPVMAADHAALLLLIMSMLPTAPQYASPKTIAL
jgi:hypothetical protein